MCACLQQPAETLQNTAHGQATHLAHTESLIPDPVVSHSGRLSHKSDDHVDRQYWKYTQTLDKERMLHAHMTTTLTKPKAMNEHSNENTEQQIRGGTHRGVECCNVGTQVTREIENLMDKGRPKEEHQSRRNNDDDGTVWDEQTSQQTYSAADAKCKQRSSTLDVITSTARQSTEQRSRTDGACVCEEFFLF